MTFGRHLSSKNLRDSQPAHMEEEDKMAQPQQSPGEERTRGDQVVLSGRDNNSTMQSEHTVRATHVTARLIHFLHSLIDLSDQHLYLPTLPFTLTMDL
jgi:hypothetical protein